MHKAKLFCKGRSQALRLPKAFRYTEHCAIYYGKIKARLKKQGCLIGGNDLLIAAHALAENAILITNNQQEFNRVEKLVIEDWAGI